MQYFSAVCVLAIVCVANGKEGDQGKGGQVSPLVSAADTVNLLQAKGVRILDLAHEKSRYEKQHIENAAYVAWIDDIADREQKHRYNVIGKVAFEQLMRRLGVRSSDHVVLYDDLASRLSTRMYWTMKVYGHDKVSVMDGGFVAWKKMGGKLTAEVTKNKPSNYRVKKINESYRIRLSGVRSQLNDSKTVMIDGRPPAQFSGELPGRVFHTNKPHQNRGHIPGACNVFWKKNFNKDGTFRSVKELRKLYRNAGAMDAEHVVTYCNEGLHAAPPWFVLHELLGVKNTQVYDDSMAEWANGNNPIAATAEPATSETPK